MPLIGDQQDDDRVQIAELVLSKMNQAVPRTSSSSAVRAAAGQPAQVLRPQTLYTPAAVMSFYFVWFFIRVP